MLIFMLRGAVLGYEGLAYDTKRFCFVKLFMRFFKFSGRLNKFTYLLFFIYDCDLDIFTAF